MKYTPILFFLLCSFNLIAQFCTDDDRFTEIDYFQDNQIDTLLNIEYARAPDFQDSLNILRMDIYMPSLAADPLEQRPFVLQMFGGGFVAGNKIMMRGDCMELARKGFVCAAIDYRLGDVAGGRAIYRAQQDAHAAMRWIVANADTYGINTNWLFAGGQSAGAIAAGYLHYSSQEDWDTTVPSMADSLGNIDVSGNDLTTTFDLKGIIMNWGAVRIDHVSPSEMVPMIAFHGDEDPIVPVDSSALGSGGSRWLHNALVQNEICSDLTIAPGAGHSPPVLFPPGFRMPKASCFFKRLFCAECNSVYVEENIPANCATTVSASNDLNQGSILRVFPNPSTNEISIVTEPSFKGSFEIYNILGTFIIKSTEQIINVNTLQPGPYILLKRHSNGRLESIPFIKN